MGNYLNKIPNPFSATSTSGGSGGSGDDPNRIAQALTLFMATLLIGSVFAGSAGAASVMGITTDEPTYDGSGHQVYIQHTVDSAASGDTDTIVIDNGGGMTVDQDSIQVAMSSAASVSTVTQAVNETIITLTYNENISSETQIDISTAFTANEAGTATVSVDGTQESTNFDYEPSASISVSPDTAGSSSTTTISQKIGSDVASASLNGFEIESADFDYSDVGQDDVQRVGFDLDNDGEIDTSVSDDLSSVSASQDGSTLTVGFGGSYSMYEDERLVVEFADSVNPDQTGNYTVDMEINPQSSGGTDAATLEVVEDTSTSTPTDTATPTETETSTPVDYSVTVEDNGSALDSFDITLTDNDSDVASASVGENDSNTVTFQNLSEGDYTVEVNYTEDGNETTYTESVTVDSEDAENGTVSQTVDVNESDDGFFGGVPSFDNPFSGITDAFDNLNDQLPDDPAMLTLTVIAGFVGIVGFLFVLFWTIIGILANRPRI